MAWRIQDSVVHGEVDNRRRGRVIGKLWVQGLSEPIRLELKGNACPDLAGCLLQFRNRDETSPLAQNEVLHPIQQGAIGDLTASRKVWKPLVPIKEFLRLQEAGLPAPESLANCLYLEWYSDTNGRVVIESTDYTLVISEPAWRLTDDEEQQRQVDSAVGFNGFLQTLNQAVEKARYDPPPDKEWDEFDYEKFMRESDARTDKLMELYEKYEGHPELEAIIAKEMGWEHLEASVQDVPEEATTPSTEDSEHDLPPPDPSTEGVDWVRDEQGDVAHPLALRAFRSGISLWQQCQALDTHQAGNATVLRMVGEFQTTGAKLAGALNGLAYGRDHRDAALIVATLKRALGHLHKAHEALAAVHDQRLLSEPLCTSTRKEFFALREEILRLMQEFRNQHGPR